ncbi:MAG: hypothetical protein AAGI36_11335 [Pseudomonadota bacterium]
MQFNIAHVLVTNPEDIRLVGFEPRKRSCLKRAHHIGLLRFRGVVLDVERDNARCVSPFAGVAVDQVAGQIGVPRQDFGCHFSPDGLAGDALAIFGVGRDLAGQEVLDR